MKKHQAKLDWMKIIKVIASIDDSKQLECAKNLIKNFVGVHGQDCDHKLLELKLKAKRLELKK